MLDTMIALLAAHLIADFVLQPDWMIARKRHLLVLVLHIAIVTGLSALLLGRLDTVVLGVVAATHLVMDAAKLWVLFPARAEAELRSLNGATEPEQRARRRFLHARRLRAFLLDQAVHLAVILLLALHFPHAFSTDVLRLVLAPDELPTPVWLGFLTFISGLVAIVPAGGHLVALASARFQPEQQDSQSLDGAGRMIGWLERAITFALILAAQPAGIGFLIAAKSLLRFGELQARHERQMSEYVIIGTFMSFGWAIALGFLARAGLAHYLPALIPA